MNLKNSTVVAALVVAGSMLVAAPAGAALFPGPDLFGYVGTEIPNNLRDVSTSGTAVALTDDDVSADIPIGFTIDFYDTSVSTISISSNGFLIMGGSSNGTYVEYVSVAIPNPGTPNGMIAGHWGDLNPPEGGTIAHQNLGSEFVVGFYGVPGYGGPAVTFEMLIHGDGAIELQYGTLADQGTTTAGIENFSGTDGLQLFNSSTPTGFSNRGFQFAVPEPSSIALAVLGLLGVLAYPWRKRRAG